MRSAAYSSIDPNNGNVTWNGPLSVEKGDHAHMPSRNASYLPGDERGHVNASSLGGVNTRANVVAQSAEVNHGAYNSLEQGERTALQNGATIDSEKTAFVNGQPGDRPTAFMVNDTITYSDLHTETVHYSFANESYADQQAWNDLSASLPDTFSAPNPADGLRDSMTTAQYAELMESTDAALPGSIAGDYAPTTSAEAVAADSSMLASADIATEADAADIGTDADVGADADDGADAGTSAGDDGGASCGTDD